MFRSNWLPNAPVGVGLILVAALVALILSNQNIYSKCGDARASDQHEAARCSDDPRLVDYNVVKSADADPEPYWDIYKGYEDLKAQRQMAKWAFSMVVVSTIGIFVTMVGVIYVAMTLDASRAAVKAAQDTIEVTREMGEKQAQAYLICNNGAFRHRVLEDRDPTGRPIYAINCNFAVENKGQSPARKIDITYEGWILIQTGPGSSRGLVDFEGRTFCADVGPHDQEVGIIESDCLTANDAREIEMNRMAVSISGEISWRNEFGNPQSQKFNLMSPMVFAMKDFRRDGKFDDSLTVPLKGIGRRSYKDM